MKSSQESINVRYILWRDGKQASDWPNILRTKLEWDSQEIDEFLKGKGVGFDKLQELSNVFDRSDEELTTEDLLGQEGIDVVGENLRALFESMVRGEKKKIAEYLEVEPETVSRWLSGKHHPPAQTLENIATYFGLNRDCDLTVIPLFLSVEPVSILSQKNWVYRKIECMSDDEVRELFPAFKKMLS